MEGWWQERETEFCGAEFRTGIDEGEQKGGGEEKAKVPNVAEGLGIM